MARERSSKEILSTYRETVLNMISEKREAKLKINSEIEALNCELEEVNEKISASIIAGDNEAFKELSDQRNFCELRIKYLQEQLKVIPSKTASESESNDFARNVLKQAKKTNADNTAKAKKLISELQLLIDDSVELAFETNNILNLWNENIGDITVSKTMLGAFFTSDLANLKEIEKVQPYRRIRDGLEIF